MKIDRKSDTWKNSYLCALSGGRSVDDAWAMADVTYQRLQLEVGAKDAAERRAAHVRTLEREKFRLALRPGAWLKHHDSGAFLQVCNLTPPGLYPSDVALRSITNVAASCAMNDMLRGEEFTLADFEQEVRDALGLCPEAAVTIVWADDGLDIGDFILDVLVESVSTEAWGLLDRIHMPLAPSQQKVARGW